MPDVVQLVEEKPEKTPDGPSADAPPRTTWSGNLRIGLVNIPVKALLMTKDVRISFRMLHRSCKTQISFKRFCQEGEEVTLADIVYGYPLGKDQYAVLEKKEIEAARPESKNTIALDRFVNFFEIDPHYFEKTYLLLPDKSEEAYSLLRTVMEKTAKAAIGRISLRSRERPVLVHYYRKAVVATTLRYPEEVLDPENYQAIRDLPEPKEKELELALEIIKSLSGELDLSSYRDQYKERIEALVRSKMAGTVEVPEMKKTRPAAKSLMEALRLTAESVK
jgi:DNA end-binding protein Ku